MKRPPMPRENGMKKILMIATGGTIASRRTEKGLAPLISSKEVIHFVPEVQKVCHVDTIQLLNLDSTNISPENWLLMANTIEAYYDAYDGFVITHGTDTMAYTAAALSYMIQKSPKPIVITGSQKPIDMEITDAKTNLFDSFCYAAFRGASGVQIVFDGKVILGTRAKKLRTKSYNAFSSINFPILAAIREGRVLSYIRQPKDEKPIFSHILDTKIGMLKMIPGTSPEVLRFLLQNHDAVIIESYGTGGLPDLEGSRFYDVLQEFSDKVVVMTTQAPMEGSDMTVYTVGKTLKEAYGILEAYDMTLEAVVTKLMWVLGQTRNAKEIEKLFYTPISHDIYAKEETYESST